MEEGWTASEEAVAEAEAESWPSGFSEADTVPEAEMCSETEAEM